MIERVGRIKRQDIATHWNPDFKITVLSDADIEFMRTPICSPDIQTAMGTLATSDDPFDVWFRGHIMDVHGMDISEESAPPEQILDFRA